jgi:hypothetical protein
MTREQEIIKAFDRYCKRTGMKPSTVGMWAHKDSKLYMRLLAGKSVRLETHAKLIAWFKEHTPKRNGGIKTA